MRGELAVPGTEPAFEHPPQVGDFLRVDRRNRRASEAGLDPVDGITLSAPLHGTSCRGSHHRDVVAQVDAPAYGRSRHGLLATSEADNVLATRPIHHDGHRTEPYRNEHAPAGECLPSTELLTHQAMVLATSTARTTDEVTQVGELIATVVRRAPEVRSLSLGSLHPWT